jgi:hypothetical protein
MIAKSAAINGRGVNPAGVRQDGRFSSGDVRLCLGFETEIDVSRPDRGAEVSRGHKGEGAPSKT